MTNSEHDDWVQWIDSDEGKKCADALSLAAPDKNRDFLVNRLWRAFTAGQQSGIRIHKNRAVDAFRGLIG